MFEFHFHCSKNFQPKFTLNLEFNWNGLLLIWSRCVDFLFYMEIKSRTFEHCIHFYSVIYLYIGEKDTIYLQKKKGEMVKQNLSIIKMIYTLFSIYSQSVLLGSVWNFHWLTPSNGSFETGKSLTFSQLFEIVLLCNVSLEVKYYGL